jgi:preprotein translocase subunit SecG
MNVATSVLPYAQISVSIFLIGSILLQQTGAGLGEMFGGQGDAGFHTRRGLEKNLFYATIALAIIFFVLAVLAVITH